MSDPTKLRVWMDGKEITKHVLAAQIVPVRQPEPPELTPQAEIDAVVERRLKGAAS